MTFKIILENRAINDAKASYNYYELIQLGLGDRFMKELERRIKIIQLNQNYSEK